MNNQPLTTSRDTHHLERIKLLETVLSATADFNYLFDREGRFAYTNRALADLLRTTADEMVGKNFHDLQYPSELATRLQNQIEQVFTTGQRLVDETPFTNARGETGYYEYVFVPVYNDDGDIDMVAGSTRDITDRKNAQLALARSNKELEAFAYVSSHDLKEPLRKISNCADLLTLENKDKLTEHSLKYLDHITTAAHRMNDLIDNLLALSRVGYNKVTRQSTNINEALIQVISDLEASIQEAGAEITYDDLPTIKVDATQIRQVLQNLISNAIKFRGTLKPKVHVSSQTDAQETRISVRDNGIGIDPQYAQRIFEIFQRLHGGEKYPGTGVGLAICKKIIEAHHGHIWMESEPGKGSTFHFTIKTMA